MIVAAIVKDVMMMSKVDLKKELKDLYFPSAARISLIDVPAFNFIMIDGVGDPNTAQAYRESIEALYAVSFTLKFTAKREQGVDYTVMPLEGLWWADDMEAFVTGDKMAWKWTSMIMQPSFITEPLVDQAREQAAAKRALPAIADMRFERFNEGLSAQVMHIGPYADEGPTIEKLRAFIERSGYKRRGKHHEIYLGDPRRAAPEKLKTVLRQPVC
ncbi:MAG: GyrI-like domain-containing protein [Halobacteriota archaeon]